MDKIKLEHDQTKDKYYLTINSDLITFYGDYALIEYLTSDLNLSDNDINELFNNIIKLGE